MIACLGRLHVSMYNSQLNCPAMFCFFPLILPPTDSYYFARTEKKLDIPVNCNERKTNLRWLDTQSEIILSQGRTLQQRKEDLFDEYERFRAIGNESIHDYFVRFHKLVNDMKITQLGNPYSIICTLICQQSSTYGSEREDMCRQCKEPKMKVGLSVSSKNKALLREAKEKGIRDAAQLRCRFHGNWSSTMCQPTSVNEELSREQAYWLPANERASQTSNPNSPVTPFIHKSRPPSQVLASLQKVNAVFHQFEVFEQQLDHLTTISKNISKLLNDILSKSNVCGGCNKSLVFANHNDCLVMCNDSVNVKPHQTKRLKRQPKKEWKPTKNVGKPIQRVWTPISKPVANSKPQWKPTGRHFSLFEKYPLTRIMEPTDMPIELPSSASSSPQITMVVQIVLWYLDSGCSRHMTGDRARLINFVEKFIGTVRFGNDEYAAIVGYGDYKLEVAFPTAFMSHPQLRYGGSTQWFTYYQPVLHLTE
ncbi:hypothetical protein Tco_1407269 [Tanacetum coccineum]